MDAIDEYVKYERQDEYYGIVAGSCQTRYDFQRASKAEEDRYDAFEVLKEKIKSVLEFVRGSK